MIYYEDDCYMYRLHAKPEFQMQILCYLNKKWFIYLFFFFFVKMYRFFMVVIHPNCHTRSTMFRQ